MHRRALEDFTEEGYERGRTQALANLAEDLILLDRLDEAETLYREALLINRTLMSPEGIGMNLWQLGRLCLRRGQLQEARGNTLGKRSRRTIHLAGRRV